MTNYKIPKTQKNFWLSDYSLRQLNEIMTATGFNQSDVAAIALEKLYVNLGLDCNHDFGNAEKQGENTPLDCNHDSALHE